MTTINQLTSQDTVSAGDLFPIYSQNNGDARAVAASTLAKYIAAANPTTVSNTQYVSPAATGTLVQAAPVVAGQNLYIRSTPLASYAALTFAFPLSSTLVDKQTIRFFTTQAITSAITFTLNGATAFLGAPTTLAQYGWFQARYDLISNTWDRVD